MAVINPSWPYLITANKFVLNINLNPILIAEMTELILDGFILLSGVRLLWDHYHAGSNHWSFRGRKTVLRPKLVPRLKKFFAPSCRGRWGLKSLSGFWPCPQAPYVSSRLKARQAEKKCDPGSETPADGQTSSSRNPES